MGVTGTAGMIRIMRANLLDELKKPYVTTARAKGVRPIKLLLKYPVRVALNPFISGIGHIFPQLVSGGAIVAMVLSLPTVGPLLLSALFSEDMYLAGSMLMVLSLLGVLGTLGQRPAAAVAGPAHPLREDGRMSDNKPTATVAADTAPATDKGALSQWQLIRLNFAKHKLAVASLFFLDVPLRCGGAGRVVRAAGPQPAQRRLRLLPAAGPAVGP
jgi:hypothetical protein